MNRQDLEMFKQWFSDFTKTFTTPDTEDQKNIALKVHHTYLVRENSVHIAREERVPQRETLLTETAALFHDIGRFPQYEKYKTFRDSVSVNHGRLGAEILHQQRILRNIPHRERETIINAVKFHNAFTIPEHQTQETQLILKILRDADKLDIWRVFAEYYEGRSDEQASAITLELSDTPEYSEELLHYLDTHTVIPLSKLTFLNDFKLMQLSWVADLNFRSSFRLLSERNLLCRIASTLPQTEKIRTAISLMNEHVTAVGK